ncbi:MAG: tetratricopeptide repeat-containing glycosyltransferase family protein [Rhodospirillales bacterium]
MTALPDLLARAMAAHRAGRFAEAGELYADCLARDPGNPDLLHLSGLLRYQEGDNDAALDLVGRALVLRPATPLYLGSRAAILIACRRFAEARTALETALGLKPDDPGLLTKMGQVLDRTGETDAALASYGKAFAIDPSHADALVNRGNLLERLDRIDAALENLRAALALAPGNADILNNLGFACLSGKRLEEAERWFDRAIDAAPDHVEAHINRAHLYLLSGRFEAGWREYEWRRRRPGWRIADIPSPEWRGEAIAGKRILIVAEQGFGDSIQFCRHAADLAALGAEVSLLVDPPVRGLLSTVPGVSACHDSPAVIPVPDFHIPAMSLPFRLGIAGQSADAAYLQPPSGMDKERGIGICIAGNPRHWNDRRRSLPAALASQVPLFRRDGLVSLHRDAPYDAALPDSLCARGDLADFTDLARIVAGLDLVIAVDTAVAHLAGALGRPCWLLLPYLPDWRWGLEGDSTPLYPSLRLFRQDSPGDWEGVLDRVASALDERGTLHHD